MIELLKLVRRPHITEKSTRAKELANTLCFRVDPRANKIEVRRAVERLFEVKVDSVRILRVPGKPKRSRGFVGRRPGWKKAYVRLKPGQKSIEYFEGM
jgi:large subunit ribosomal protein L23